MFSYISVIGVSRQVCSSLSTGCSYNHICSRSGQLSIIEYKKKPCLVCAGLKIIQHEGVTNLQLKKDPSENESIQ